MKLEATQTRSRVDDGRELALEPPEPRDAAAIWELVADTPGLDDNSPYAYLLLCSHFASTGIVAHIGDALAGFVLGYTRPDHRDTAFVWQIAVAEAARGRGLGGRLLDAWFARCALGSSVHSLEATVTRSNEASRALFSSFGRRHGAPLRESVAFSSSLFPAAVDHEEEIGIHIGPMPLTRALTPRTQETT